MGAVVFMFASAVLLSGWLATKAPAGGGRGPGSTPWRPRWLVGGRRATDDTAQWARRGDLQSLVVKEPDKGRVTLGRSCRRLLAVDIGHSLLVLGRS